MVSSSRLGRTLLALSLVSLLACDEPEGGEDAGVDGDADSDEGSYSSGTRTIDLGDGNNSNNAQLDLTAGRVWAVVFTIRIQ